jgi:predicted DNA-binding transcriptional regulator AlpA
MSVPSIRECTQRLAAMADTQQIINDLESLEEELALDQYPEPLQRARNRLLALQELCRHMSQNMRMFGTPPAPPAVPAKVPAVSITARADVPSAAPRASTWIEVHAATRAQQAPMPAPKRPSGNSHATVVVPANRITSREILEHFARGHAWLHKMMSTGGFPRPVENENCGPVKFWDKAAVLAWQANSWRPRKKGGA